MALIDWNESFSVGVAELDGQHQRLADLINRLDIQAREGNGKHLEGAIQKLTVYAFTHFGHEEKLLAEAGYPDLEAHRGEHDDFGQRLMAFSRDAAAGMLDRARLIRFLTQWWNHHILEEDRRYKPFLCGPGESSQEKPGTGPGL